MFERYIAVDWSGAGHEEQRVDLRVAETYGDLTTGRIVAPPVTKQQTRKWSRAECRSWLAIALRPGQPRCIVAMDFGFGLPWGADRAAFGAEGWRAMIGVIGDLYTQRGTARAVAEAVNRLPHLGGHGPFRFNESRTDFRFYLDHHVGYYRLVDQAVPQAISHWYLGSGGTVGFHTLTGLAALDGLLARRERGELDFQLWPHEGEVPERGRHLLVECYPALYPRLDDPGPCRDSHEVDAWRALTWMAESDRAGTLQRALQPKPLTFGRVDGVPLEEQMRFEGWIVGVR